MACSNASGSRKLPLLFIGRAANSRCFKNVNKAVLPVVYKPEMNAWVDAAIFTDWFNCHFVPSVKKHLIQTPQVLLFLDNAPAHPDCSVLVRPPNTTALVQHMNQGVLEALQRRYKKSMLQKLLLQNQAARSVIECKMWCT